MVRSIFPGAGAVLVFASLAGAQLSPAGHVPQAAEAWRFGHRRGLDFQGCLLRLL